MFRRYLPPNVRQIWDCGRSQRLGEASPMRCVQVLRGHRAGSEVWSVDVVATNIFSGGQDGLAKVLLAPYVALHPSGNVYVIALLARGHQQTP